MQVRDLKHFFRDKRKPGYGALDILKYIGPGLLVTVGFIDPGNWASNLAAGSDSAIPVMDDHPFHPHADHPAAQCCPPGDCHGPLPGRSSNEIYSPVGFQDVVILGHGSFRFHITRGDPGSIGGIEHVV